MSQILAKNAFFVVKKFIFSNIEEFLIIGNFEKGVSEIFPLGTIGSVYFSLIFDLIGLGSVIRQ